MPLWLCEEASTLAAMVAMLSAHRLCPVRVTSHGHHRELQGTQIPSTQIYAPIFHIKIL